MAKTEKVSLMTALGTYLVKTRSGEQPDGHQELNRFIQWCGRDRGVQELTPAEIADYAGSAGMWGADSALKMKSVKSFLTYLRQGGMVTVSLAPHLKASKSRKNSRRVYFKASTEQAELSAEGHSNLTSRLEMLKEERVKIVADIQRAMADKDFRENAPLDAAKERQGFIEAAIRELEGILATAVVRTAGKTKHTKKVVLGKKVTLKDTNSGKLLRYTVVDTREADPITGKISSISPVGKAVLDREIGEEIHVTVPKGTMRYVIEKIES